MKYITIILTITVIVLIVLLSRSCEDINNRDSINAGLNSKLKVWRNHIGQVEAERNAIYATSAKQLLEIENLQGTNKRLQDILIRDQRSSTAISHDTRTEIIYRTDTVTVIDTVRGQPVYYAAFSDQWKSGEVTMAVDSLNLKVTSVNKYDYKITKSKHWFKPDTVKVNVVNLNPHTTTDDLSGFTLIEAQKNWSVGPSIGYGFTGSGKPSVFIGVSLQYSLIQF